MSSSEQDVYLKCLRRIKSADARSAFDYLVSHAKTVPEYRLIPTDSGKLAYTYKLGPRSLFAFIVNQEDLLFYFRHPHLTNASIDFALLEKQFHRVEWDKKVITLHIRTVAEAKRLAEVVFGRATS